MVRRFMVLVAGLVFFSTSVWAGDAGLEAELESLKRRLAALESKIASQQAVASGAEEGAAVITLPSGLHGVEISGFVDTAYTYNFNEPEDLVNDGRIFDTAANSFVLNNFQLNVGKAATEGSPVGFYTALMFGDDAENTHSTGLFASSDSIDIQQAYIQYLAPVGEGLDISVGKRSTLIGAEVIESIDNWNYSRSFLFGLAIPFTHTGIRASYPISETMTLTTGINNGWDVADDDNIGKGIEGQLAWSPSDDFFVSLTGMFSPEVGPGSGADFNKGSERWVTDVVATYQVNDKLALMMNYDFGYQADVKNAGDENAGWQGFATYAKYQVDDKWSLAGRYEVFRDYDATRLPTLSVTGLGDLTLQEFTLTSEHQIHENLLARLEYRHDIANTNVFGKDDGGLQNYQDTVAMEFILPF